MDSAAAVVENLWEEFDAPVFQGSDGWVPFMDNHLKHHALKRHPLWLLPVMGWTMAKGATA